MSRISKFIDWLTAQLGSIYVWGGQGEVATEAFIDKHETSKENAKRAKALLSARKAAGMKEVKAYDCSGLIVCYFLDKKYISSDMTAAGLYGKCAKINRKSIKTGDLVFRYNGKSIHHVGVYVGNGNVIHAKGRDYGVVREGIDANGSDYWNRFGRFEALDVVDIEMIKITKPLMRSKGIRKLQDALNALGYDCGTVDGIAGSKTIAAIGEFIAVQSPKAATKSETSTTKSVTKSNMSTVTTDDGVK